MSKTQKIHRFARRYAPYLTAIGFTIMSPVYLDHLITYYRFLAQVI
ncbi:hypothetical protein AAAC13_01640 [Pseudomonas aeruginosa]|nr:hypothetical protein [Pseudomonas aeruginosa]EKV2975631.1 hypothetical protein [Pseudomonas aeruginosa]EKV3160286.1 hypothetical protein [Pseudomonas aeruginosa]EKW6212500.1 hypothetical protein [Pseudomonas aeruginosa]EKW7604400.1 hypothetical protein [Pseudomonas aeruginosa]ELL1219593.1 hypothetical protein [Pseudomonas aeruginosa]